MRKSEKLAAAGRMSATVAHEINNPLASVTNLIYLARLKEANSAVVKYLDAADNEIKRISHITNQTLGFYRESAKPTQISIGKLIDDVIELLSWKINLKMLIIERAYEKPDEIEAFEGEIRQIFSNIIANAIDASPHTAKLRVAVSASNSSRRSWSAGRHTGFWAGNLGRKPFSDFRAISRNFER